MGKKTRFTFSEKRDRGWKRIITLITQTVVFNKGILLLEGESHMKHLCRWLPHGIVIVSLLSLIQLFSHVIDSRRVIPLYTVPMCSLVGHSSPECTLCLAVFSICRCRINCVPATNQLAF